MLFFCLQLIVMWPVHYELSAEKYNKIIKGRICSKTPIPEFLAEKIDAEFSLRPKLLSTAITFLAVGSSWYWNRAAKKERQRLRIPTDRRNVMNSDQMLIEWFV